MSDFSAAVRRRAGMPQPMTSPGPMGQPSPPAGGGLVQALQAANAELARAIQSGDLPPEAMAEIQKFAQLIAQMV